MDLLRAKIIDIDQAETTHEEFFRIDFNHIKSHVQSLDPILIGTWALMMRQRSFKHHLPTAGHKVSISEKAFLLESDIKDPLDIVLRLDEDTASVSLKGAPYRDVSFAFYGLTFEPYYATIAKMHSTRDKIGVPKMRSFEVISEFFRVDYGHGGDILMAYIDAFVAAYPDIDICQNRGLDFILTACARQKGLNREPGSAHLYRDVGLMLVNARYLDTHHSPFETGFKRGAFLTDETLASGAPCAAKAAQEMLALLAHTPRKIVVYATTLLRFNSAHPSAFEEASAHEVMAAQALAAKMMDIINALPLPD